MNYKMWLTFLIQLFFWCTIPSCKDPQKQQKIFEAESRSNKINYREESIDLEKVLDMRKSVRVNVKYDHYFKAPKQYKGFLVREIIDSVIKYTAFDTTQGIVIFNCIDGYRAIVDVSKFYGKAKGFVVFKDLDMSPEESWPDSVSQKFGKYYLVWDNVLSSDNSFSWPYGIESLKLVNSEEEFKPIFPSDKLLMTKGFNLFRNHCIKCHSLNNVGGLVGPELNIPRNITEYWKEEDIISYAKNPADYRLNSKMPPLNDLIGDSDLREVLKYIKYMKDHKAPY